MRSKLRELMVLPSPVSWTAMGTGVVGPRVTSKRARRAPKYKLILLNVSSVSNLPSTTSKLSVTLQAHRPPGT